MLDRFGVLLHPLCGDAADPQRASRDSECAVAREAAPLSFYTVDRVELGSGGSYSMRHVSWGRGDMRRNSNERDAWTAIILITLCCTPGIATAGTDGADGIEAQLRSLPLPPG